MKHLIALAQYTPILGDIEKNISRHLELIDRAIEGGAEMIVFPELSITGYMLRDLTSEVALHLSDERFTPFYQRSKKIIILVGAVEEDNNFGLYNSAFIFSSGSVTTHRKIYPPDYGLFEEGRYFLSGKNLTSVYTPIGKIGVLICEDLWHISLPLLLALDDVQCIVTIAASPTRMAQSSHLTNDLINTENHRVLARLLSLYVVFVNRTGFEDGINFWGGSEIIAPNGDVTIKAQLFEEELLFGTIDYNLMRRARHQARHFMDERPDFLLQELKRILKK